MTAVPFFPKAGSRVPSASRCVSPIFAPASEFLGVTRNSSTSKMLPSASTVEEFGELSVEPCASKRATPSPSNAVSRTPPVVSFMARSE